MKAANEQQQQDKQLQRQRILHVCCLPAFRPPRAPVCRLSTRVYTVSGVCFNSRQLPTRSNGQRMPSRFSWPFRSPLTSITTANCDIRASCMNCQGCQF